MTVTRVYASSFFIPVAPFQMRLQKPPMTTFKSGDSVKLKPNTPSELQKYVGEVGVYQDHVGDFSRVHFNRAGTVSIKTAYLTKS